MDKNANFDIMFLAPPSDILITCVHDSNSTGAMNTRQVRCISGPCYINLSVLWFVPYWDLLSLYGHIERTKSLSQNLYRVGILVKSLEVNLLHTWLVVKGFRRNWTGISLWKCMGTPCIKSEEGFYFGRISNLKCFNSKRQCLFQWIWLSKTDGFSEDPHPLIASNSLIEGIWKFYTLQSMLGRSNVSKM